MAKKSTSWWYWLLPIGLFIVALLFTVNSLGQVRQEELSESISYPFWLQARVVCNGVTTQLGWYLPLMIFYKLFGFGLFYARYLRLVLQLVSYFCLAFVLKKYLGEKRAWVPLLVIGLSPTLLYFNTLGVSYGLDLQIFPICLFLVLSIDFEKKWDILKQILLWVLAMLTWMAYPTFIFYLPVIWGIFLWRLKNADRKRLAGTLLLNIGFFLTPLALAVAYVKNRSVLIYDPAVGGGLFRAHGQVSLSFKTFFENLQILKNDLFISSVSYYFEVAKVELSDFYPLLAIAAVILACSILWLLEKKLRTILILLLALFVLNLILSNLTGELGGIRRATSLLTLFYTFFCFGWYFVNSAKINWAFKMILTGTFLLILVHHLVVIPANLQSLSADRKFSEGQWFSVDETPQKSLDSYVLQIQKTDLALVCTDQTQQPVPCGGYEYNLIYPAIAGTCQWRGLLCHRVQIYDFKIKQVVPLALDCWTNHVGL